MIPDGAAMWVLCGAAFAAFLASLEQRLNYVPVERYSALGSIGQAVVVTGAVAAWASTRPAGLYGVAPGVLAGGLLIWFLLTGLSQLVRFPDRLRLALAWFSVMASLFIVMTGAVVVKH